MMSDNKSRECCTIQSIMHYLLVWTFEEVEVEGKKKKMTRNYLAFEAMNGSGLFNYNCGGGGLAAAMEDHFKERNPEPRCIETIYRV